MEYTSIGWTDHTQNFWWICDKVHEGCRHCYAEAWANRHGFAWGLKAPRLVTSQTNRNKPLKWNRLAEKSGKRLRVFCQSMSDFCDAYQGTLIYRDRSTAWKCDSCGNELKGAALGTPITLPSCNCGLSKTRALTLDDLRSQACNLFSRTQWIDYQVLTKRPEEIRKVWTNRWVDGCWPKNVWFGTSISDQQSHDQLVPELQKCRELSPVLFLSIEPLLDEIKLNLDGIDWVIVGGESGPHARPYVLEYAVSILLQCKRAGVPVFHKQLGKVPVTTNVNLYGFDGELEPWGDYACGARFILSDRKGESMNEWPDFDDIDSELSMKVREFPTVRAE